LRREALAMREAERRKAEADAARLIEEAKAQARDALEHVRAEIENELRAGERELERLSQVLAVALAAQVLGRPVDGAAPEAQETSNN
jgi:F0F1-type ATP synthase membrane subunit b/b'